jgi:7,8-dihydropterin-6-yl-methyl-4-(beta-D-ribofuranosyl)aminobenzene 5'-phosphate synthase
MSRITVLSDNRAAYPFSREHGLSLYIEHAGHRILFDTGHTPDPLFHNAYALGIDLSLLDAVVISHGHYDHTGNIARILRMSPRAQVYLSPHAMDLRYSVKDDSAPKYAGISAENRSALMQNTHRITWVHSPEKICKFLFVTGPIPRITDYEDRGGNFYHDQECLRRDELYDDCALWIETPRGLAVICGCCHSGLVNTLTFIREQTTTKSVHTIMGGLHLKAASQERIQKTADYLREISPRRMVCLHCSGEAAIDQLQKLSGCAFHWGMVGHREETEDYDYEH